MTEHRPGIIDASPSHHVQRPDRPRPAWSGVLRGLREARGVTQDGWAAQVGYGRATVQRWERGEAVPGADATEALVTLCRELGLLRRFERGRLTGLSVTAELLRELLAEARFEVAPGSLSGELGGADSTDEDGSAVAPGPSQDPRKASSAPPHNLPIFLSSFIGRDPELRSIKELLHSTRLLTLVGAGGCGKTRLALQIGLDLTSDYVDGVWLIDLAPLAAPDLLPHIVATTLGVATAPDESILTALVTALKIKELLLLLDNCEHLIGACAQLAEAVLQQCPDVRILATSREALRIAGEVHWRVPPLAAPPEDAGMSLGVVTQYDAARLLLERASSVLPAFQPQESEASAIARICRRLDGLPLALELAAPLVAVLSVDQIADRLDRRFQVLLEGSRTALPRHQTLAALVNWSYDLLDEAQRTLFRRLAVFAGDFSLEAVETVCVGDDVAPDAVVHLVLRLVEKSLVVAEPGVAGGGRYRLLETLRQFGWERLDVTGEAELLGEHHAQYYLALAEEGERGLYGQNQVSWLWRLDRDHDNLRAAVTWLERKGQIEAALRLAGALAHFWGVRGYYAEGRAHLTRLLARTAGAKCSVERGKALWGMGALADRQGDYRVVGPFLEQSLAVASQVGDRVTAIRVLASLGLWAMTQLDFGRARLWVEEALARARELGDGSCLALALRQLAWLEAMQGEDERARAHAEELLTLCRQTGDSWHAGWALTVLGNIAFYRADYGTARAHFEEKLTIARTLGDRSSIANGLIYLGLVDAEQDARLAARARFEEGLAIYRDRGDKVGIAFATSNLCTLALADGGLRPARAFADESLTAARGAAGAADIQVMALLCNGDDALAEGDVAAAWLNFAEGLTLLHPDACSGLAAQVLQALARVAAARNQPARALRLAAQAAAVGAWGPILRPPSIDKDYLEQALATMSTTPSRLSPEAQVTAWGEGEAMTLDQAFEYALEEEHA
jgi:predicted ATPase/transcriptional regulator with XRE-family HTH domain